MITNMTKPRDTGHETTRLAAYAAGRPGGFTPSELIEWHRHFQSHAAHMASAETIEALVRRVAELESDSDAVRSDFHITPETHAWLLDRLENPEPGNAERVARFLAQPSILDA